MDGIDNATSFVRFMERVWEMDDETLYDRHHNAVFSARYFGARKTGNTEVNGEQWYLYRFPNQSAVAINHGGSAVVERKPHKYSPKPRKA